MLESEVLKRYTISRIWTLIDTYVLLEYAPDDRYEERLGVLYRYIDPIIIKARISLWIMDFGYFSSLLNDTFK
jgi:hypothetical protein